MSYTQKINKSGKIYYSFLVYDHNEKKNVRLKKNDVITRFGKEVTSLDEAIKIDGLLRSEYDSTKERYKRLMSWQDKYCSFAKLLEEYTKRQKRKSPYGWKNNVHYLKYYVLPFFCKLHRITISMDGTWIMLNLEYGLKTKQD